MKRPPCPSLDDPFWEFTPKQKELGARFLGRDCLPLKWKYGPLRNGVSTPEIETMAYCPSEEARNGMTAAIMPDGEGVLFAMDDGFFVARHLSPNELRYYLLEPNRMVLSLE